jgi:hypothetical protein
MRVELHGILADHNIEAHVEALLMLLQGHVWREFWSSLCLSVESFESIALPVDSADDEVWLTCQRLGIVLITANRRSDRPDSLEITIRTMNHPQALPVFTLTDPVRAFASKAYAHKVAERLLEGWFDMDNLRGTGRFYLP